MYWINLSQGRDRWRTLVNAVMNLQVPYSAGNNIVMSINVTGYPATVMDHLCGHLQGGIGKNTITVNKSTYQNFSTIEDNHIIII
jgi:peptide deformylase